MPTLIGGIAHLLDALLDENRESVKTTMRRSVVVHVRRVVRKSIAEIPSVLEAAVARAKTATGSIPLLGLVVDVILHLKHKQEAPLAALDKEVAAIVAVYNNAVLMSRTPASTHLAVSGFILIISTLTNTCLLDRA